MGSTGATIRPMPIAVDLWLWPLDLPDARLRALSAHLSEEETARAARFVRPEHGARFRAARGRLREILSGYTGTAPGAIGFDYGPHGKPALAGGPVFNLSHSGGWAALAVTEAEAALGLDIEAHREVEADLAGRFFSAAECGALAALRPADRAEGFFRAWTRKEALLKGVGEGLSLPLDGFDVTLAPGDPARLLASRIEGLEPEAWSLTHLDLGPGFPGCIALGAGGAAAEVTLREGHLPLPPAAS